MSVASTSAGFGAFGVGHQLHRDCRLLADLRVAAQPSPSSGEPLVSVELEVLSAAFEAGVAAAREVRAEAESSLALIDVVDRFPSLTDEDVVQWWADESTPLEDRRALIASVIDHVDILPLRESSDRDRFVVHWR